MSVLCQKGRLREFYQIDVELIGNLTPYYEVELIELALTILKKPLLEEKDPFTLEINSLGCFKCRQPFREYLLEELKEEKEDLCEICKERLLRNPLRILDCKKESCKEIVRSLKGIEEFWCEECKDHFKILKELLEERKIGYQHNSYLVRGLDYYGRTIFEIKAQGLGAQDTVCAGGRYDYLIQELGGPELPAIGFAIGIERWALTVFGEEDFPDSFQEEIKPYVILIPLGEPCKRKALEIVHSLRKERIKIFAFFEDRSLKALLKAADKSKARLALILGEEELKEGKILVKDLLEGTQEAWKIEKLPEGLKSYLK